MLYLEFFTCTFFCNLELVVRTTSTGLILLGVSDVFLRDRSSTELWDPSENSKILETHW